MANLTRAYLKHIKIIEEIAMHHHLSELKHPQWGSIVGYENHIRIAVLKDEMDILAERIEEKDRKTGNRRGDLHTALWALKDRIEELEDKEKVNVEERILYWEAEIKGSSTTVCGVASTHEEYPNELQGPGPDEEK